MGRLLEMRECVVAGCQANHSRATATAIVAFRAPPDKVGVALLWGKMAATMAQRSLPPPCVCCATAIMPDASPPFDDDDDAELELEPVDPAILEVERQRGQRKTDEAFSRVDPDELFRNEGEIGLDVDWGKWKQFRFTTRHLLILTAIMALVMTLFKIVENPVSGVAVLCVVVLGAGWYWVLRQERRQEAERARLREEFFAAHGQRGEPAAAEPPAAATGRFDLKFSFSLQEMFIAMTAAAVVLGLLALFGPDKMALALGIVALLGLVVQASGFDAPRMVVLGWWILLVLYLCVGVIAALWSKEKSVVQRATPASAALAAEVEQAPLAGPALASRPLGHARPGPNLSRPADVPTRAGHSGVGIRYWPT